MNPEGTSAASSAELLPIPLSISYLSAYHMPAPFILDSRHLTPSLKCQVLNAKFQQLVSAFKEPRMSVLLLIEGLWSSLPTRAAIFPTPFSHWKNTLAQCHQQ